MSIIYRSFRPDDAETLAAIMQRAIAQIASRVYTQEQIAAWAGRAPDGDELKDKYADGRFVVVAVAEDDMPIAFGDVMQDGHVDLLYCHPDFAGQGVASQLYDLLEAETRRRAIETMTVDASEAALPFFTKKEYRVVRRNDLQLNGIAIHNYAMEKQLV